MPPSTAEKTKAEAVSAANSTAVKSPVSGQFASQLKAKTRYGSRAHQLSEQRARDKILKDMRQINVVSFDADAHKNNMDRLLGREHQKLDLWK